MRILYVASAIEIEGTSGGATHVKEVACGLRALGHRVAVVTYSADPSSAPRTLGCGAPVRTTRWPQQLALLSLPRLARIVKQFKADVVMERFYTFAGAGVLLAHREGIPSLLEVNAPMVDPAGSLKSKVDRLLLGSMRRWAVRQALWSAAVVTPLNTTVPPEVPRSRITELPWGANVDHFDPSIRQKKRYELSALRQEIGLASEGPVAAFLGSFRAWHGARHFALAARRLLKSGSALNFLAIGGGPELAPLQEEVREWDLPAGRLVFAGSQPHERVPDLLAMCDTGVAPFDLAAHEPLQTFGFYWSPLKVFEYMAMALPVVTVDVPPLNTIVRDALEGLLYQSGDLDGLVVALKTLEHNAALRSRLGANGRERVQAHFSWQAHCASLDSLLRGIVRA